MDSNFIKKNSGLFSFSDTAANVAVNREFVEGYGQLLDGKHNEKTFIWETLSAVGNQIGDVLYENVLNYIQNVADINTCSIKSLCSISRMLGDEHYKFMDNMTEIPNEIFRLLDIFSINKHYLFDNNVLDSFPQIMILLSARNQAGYNEKIEELSSDALEKIQNGISVDVTDFLDDGFYETIISSAFFDALTRNLSATYDGKDDSSDYIFENLSNGITSKIDYSNDFLENHYKDSILSLQTCLNVDTSFNAFKEADEYEKGTKELSDFTKDERAVILKIEEMRSYPKYDRTLSVYQNGNSLTRYAYYREKKFFEYVSFIESQFLYKGGSEKLGTYYDLVSRSKEYFLDGNYVELDMVEEEDSNRRLYSKNNGTISCDIQKVTDIANVLKDMSLSIVDLREKLKTQAQKNHMRGTFLLISYLVNQYLRKNLPLQYPCLSDWASDFNNVQDSLTKSDGINVQIQEYEDNTEYFNISSEYTPNAYNEYGTNAPFWNDNSEEIGLDLKEIEDFYLTTLNLKTAIPADENGTKNPRELLDILFELGATKTYLDGRDGTTIVPGIVAEDFGLEVDKDPTLSTYYYEISALQRETFLKFNGTKIGYDPYYNYKNTTHSSYQVHPYLWKFTEYEGLKTTIYNAYYNSANEELLKILMSPLLSVHLGEYGEILNIWKDDVFDFSGYRSRYENGTHSARNGLLEHYDGIWYPSAIEDYVNATKEISSFLGLIYSVQNLKDSGNICDDFKNDEYLTSASFNGEYLSSIFSYYVDFNKEYSEKYQEFQDFLSSNPNDAEGISKLSSELDNMVKGREKTFYEKWYSGLAISKDEANYIANQLSVYQSKLLNIYSETPFNENTYDIYKYGLDKYGNSIILYKLQKTDSTYVEKRNNPGELWIRKNAHPIGFPAFDDYALYKIKAWPQVRPENINGSLSTYINGCLHKLTNPWKLSTKDGVVFYAVFENDKSHLYKSTDGGRFFEKLPLFIKISYGTPIIGNICQVSNDIVIISPLLETSGVLPNPIIYITRNGGKTWDELDYPTKPNPIGSPWGGFVWSNDGIKLYASCKFRDGGSSHSYGFYLYDFNEESPSWIEKSNGKSSYFYSLTFINNSIFYATVKSDSPFFADEPLMKTINGGENWVEVSKPSMDSYSAHVSYEIISYVNERLYFVNSYGKLFTTVNTNLPSWKQIKFSKDDNIKDVLSPINENKIYCLVSSPRTVGLIEKINDEYVLTKNALPNMYEKDSFDVFYDFDITTSYEYMALAAKKDSSSKTNDYSDSKIFFLEPTEDTSEYDSENFEYKYSYTFRPYSNDARFDCISNDYDFNGFYEDQSDIVAIFTKYDGINQIDFHPYFMPEDDGFSDISTTINLSGDFDLSVKIADDPQFIVGYDGEKFTLAFLTQMDSQLCAYTYPGKNVSFTSADTELSSISETQYGRCNYLSNALDDERLSGEHNSIDQFDTFITISTFDKNYRNFRAKHYNLNSDASYVPLYCGTYGLTRLWACEFFKDFRKERSVELLGYSFNSLSALSAEFWSKLFEDEDGNWTNTDPTQFLSCIARVYEDYNVDHLFKVYQNPALKRSDIHEVNGMSCFTWGQDLLSGISADNVGKYAIWLYNVQAGATNPIYVGDLSGVTNGITYISALNETDEYFKETGYMLPFLKKAEGTPNVFKYDFDAATATNQTNAILNIKELSMSLSNGPDSKYRLSVHLFIDDINADYIVDKNTLAMFLFNKSLEEFDQYHYLYHHTTWPYLSGETSSTINRQPLSNAYSFDEVEVLSTGTLAFKINEESPTVKYPNRAVYDALFDMFHSVNTDFGTLSNVFDLSNTYIIELEKPKEIADIIGTVKMGTYSNTNEFLFAYEEYVSAMHSVSKYDTDILSFLQFTELDNRVPPANSWNFDIEDGTDLETCLLSLDMLSGTSPLGEDTATMTYADTEIDFTVTEKDIEDYLKIYVNYLLDDKEKIHLFFNFNNLFCSPYSYRRNDGNFYTVFKPETFLHLSPGESGILTIVIQLKYYDTFGTLCGLKDIPAMTYKIWNVSDDKPKFIIKNTWKLTSESLETIKKVAIQNLSATLNIGNSVYSFSPTDTLYDSFITTTDLTGMANVTIDGMASQFGSMTCDFIYEYNDGDIEFVPSMSRGARFSEHNGRIHTISNSQEINLCFRLKAGTPIDEDTAIKEIPIEAINFRAQDANGNEMDTNVINGGIIFDFTTEGTIPDKLLALEPKFTGYVLTEANRVIKIYENKIFQVIRGV